MATRQIKARLHNRVFVPDQTIELVYGLIDEVEVAAGWARASS